jgi:hypothetical protein
MPLPKGTKFGVTKSGVRLAFKGGKVIEAKNMKTGATHTPSEFAADRKKAKIDKTPDKTESSKRKMVEKKKGIKS